MDKELKLTQEEIKILKQIATSGATYKFTTITPEISIEPKFEIPHFESKCKLTPGAVDEIINKYARTIYDEMVKNNLED